MTQKRHHYVPMLLLRRFSCDPSVDEPPIWCLEKESGHLRRTNIKNEAVIGHYNRLTSPKSLRPTAVEDFLSDVEGAAESVISKLVRSKSVTGDELGELALFVWFQYVRTPLVRTWMTHVKEMAALGQLISSMNDPDFIREHYHEWDDTLTPEDAEAMRQEALQGLLDGTFTVRVPHDSEVLGMLRSAEKGLDVVARQMSWYGLKAPRGTQFILSDHPLAIYDPAAGPDDPVGWLSSPTVEVTLPLDPTFCLLLKPGTFGYRSLHTPAENVERVNLRTYAWGHWAIYGPSAEAVQGVHAVAERKQKEVAAFAPRAPELLLAEHRRGEDRPFRVSVCQPPARGDRGRRRS